MQSHSYDWLDPSSVCFTPRWLTMSAYAGVWVIGYVFAFPILVFWKLISYAHKLKLKKKQIGELRYGFLLKVSGI